MTLIEILGVVPGVMALIGAGIGYGRLSQRIIEVEKAVDGENGLTAKLNSLNEKAGVLEERSYAHTSKLNDIKGQVDKLVDRLIQAPNRTRSR